MGQLGQELIAEAIVGGALIVLSLAIAFVVYPRWWRRPVRAFFDLGGRTGTVQIKLSCLYVNPEGARGITAVLRGFNGPAITEGEYRAALGLANEIQARPLSAFVEMIGAHFWRRELSPPLRCDISLSPARPADASMPPDHDKDGTGGEIPPEHWIHAAAHKVFGTGGTFVLVGAPVYNVLSDYVLRTVDTHAEFKFYRVPIGCGDYERGIVVRHGHQRGGGTGYVVEAYPRREAREPGEAGDRIRYTEYFIVQKISGVRIGERRATIFVCAGNSTAATVKAVEKLTNWRTLPSQGDFALLYQLQTYDRELIGDPNFRAEEVRPMWPTDST
ncbi:MAG TPA: hypothetical protein VFC00_04710 [Micromonosporaceae bacterium]|nr:hypothetical protein [Micromonosporaceae bacterium]